MSKIKQLDESAIIQSKATPITIDGTLFANLRDEVDELIISCIRKVENGGFESGDINIKIEIKQASILHEYNGVRENTPSLEIDTKAQLVLKQKYETKASLDIKEELVCDEHGYYFKELPGGQTKINMDEK